MRSMSRSRLWFSSTGRIWQVEIDHDKLEMNVSFNLACRVGTPSTPGLTSSSPSRWSMFAALILFEAEISTFASTSGSTARFFLPQATRALVAWLTAKHWVVVDNVDVVDAVDCQNSLPTLGDLVAR